MVWFNICVFFHTIFICMKLSIGSIRLLINELWWEEQYDKLLMNDPAMDAETLIVPKTSKDKIKKWAKDMKLG